MGFWLLTIIYGMKNYQMELTHYVAQSLRLMLLLTSIAERLKLLKHHFISCMYKKLAIKPEKNRPRMSLLGISFY
jgi:hypothetical protein